MNIFLCKRRYIYLLTLFFSVTSFSIGINDSKYIELGGSLDPSVMKNVSTVLEQNASDEKFNSVGLVVANGYCSGTWLGSDNTHSYILTAAHCLAGAQGTEFTGQYVSFKKQDGTVLAAGISTNYFRNFTGCSNDIAVAKIPKLADPTDDEGEIIKQPLLDNKLNKNSLLQPTILTGFGYFGTRTLGQLDYNAKRKGDGHIRYYDHHCLVNRAIENTDSWAFASSGDSGSAIWQQRNEHQVAVGVTSWWYGWYHGYSGHVPIARHIDWLKSVVPVVKTIDDISPEIPVEETQWLLTEELPIETTPLEQDVRGSVYYISGQNIVDGPSRYIWRYPRGVTRFATTLVEQNSNVEHKVWLRGQRKTHCGWGKINNSAWCYPSPNLGQLKMEFLQSDNVGLPIGNFQGSFSLIVKSLYDPSYVNEVQVNTNITITTQIESDGVITQDISYIGPRYEETIYGTVFYLSENSNSRNRPVWRRNNRGYTELEVDVTNSETGDVKTVILRGERNLGCGWTIMNNAAYCRYQRPIYGELRLSFVPDDNPNLPIGQYSGSLSVTAKGLHKRSFRKDLNFNVELNIIE
ncbi:trypsin-like serine protease [Photobacterium leiognathi]|uniref:Trypsin n=1 Tax=Photobacterium leiognathi TaxID=553611 RepID=A0A2T3MHK8_PHOLE|nr:trypsin-like serine protease [Photobacterium leiognathi]PSV93744.1 trypsin [Photobacterium leiognathi]